MFRQIIKYIGPSLVLIAVLFILFAMSAMYQSSVNIVNYHKPFSLIFDKLFSLIIFVILSSFFLYLLTLFDITTFINIKYRQKTTMAINIASFLSLIFLIKWFKSYIILKILDDSNRNMVKAIYELFDNAFHIVIICNAILLLNIIKSKLDK